LLPVHSAVQTVLVEAMISIIDDDASVRAATYRLVRSVGYFPTLARDLAITAKTPQDSDSRLAMRYLTRSDDDLCRSVGQMSGECVMKMSFKLLTAAALAVGTAALAAPAVAASIPSDNPRYGYNYAPSYVSYVPGPGYFAWQSGYSAPAAITSRDAPVTRHRDWR
jgi:hypothetical protein